MKEVIEFILIYIVLFAFLFIWFLDLWTPIKEDLKNLFKKKPCQHNYSIKYYDGKTTEKQCEYCLEFKNKPK